MTGAHPDEALRGRVTGFPVWQRIPEIDDAPDTPVLDGAVAWLAAELEWFDRARWEKFLPPRPFPEGTILELLVLCRVLRRGRFRDHPLIQAAVDLGQRVVSTAEFHDALGHGDEKFPYRAYLVALLADLGCSVPTAADRIRTVLATGTGGRTGAWHTPLSRLELRYALDLGGFPAAGPTVGELLPTTIVAAEPDPLYLRDDEVYALTHAVFYATDFAARPLPPIPGLIDTMRTLLGIYLAAGDLDLAGELLLCLYTADAPDCAVTTHARHVTTRRRRPDGAVPGPLYDPLRWSALRAETADAYTFGTCHHTTMVAAMAAAEQERRHAVL